MKNFLGYLHSRWLDWRKQKIDSATWRLKARYHTFRIVLSNNEAALELLKTIGQTVRSPAISWDDLSASIEELAETTYELVDGLEKIGRRSFAGLYSRHGLISSEIRKHLDSATLEHRASFCIFFDDFQPGMSGIAGTKASNLAFLKKSGFQVPDGFVLTESACSEILSYNRIDSFIRNRLQRLEFASSINLPELQADSSEIKKRILEAKFPNQMEDELRTSYNKLTGNSGNAVSVRSSALAEDKAGHSFAGQFKSILNVCFFESFKKAVLEVIASAYSSRAITYRINAGLPLPLGDMAVICQLMSGARAAGVLFTINPSDIETGRMLITAVHGLGISAVGGDAPATIYTPLRNRPESEFIEEFPETPVPNIFPHVSDESIAASAINNDPGHVLSFDEVCNLAECGLMIESLFGKPQDVEWAIDECGRISLLQSRDIYIPKKKKTGSGVSPGEILISGGINSSGGICAGKAIIVRSAADIKTARQAMDTPYVMILRQSLVDAAAWLEYFEGIVVDLGNPADHLSCVARECGVPMLVATGSATSIIKNDDWVVIDADSGSVRRAPEGIGTYFKRKKNITRAVHPNSGNNISPELSKLLKYIEPLNLTDAYGPTFSIQECQSMHDIIRYVHEMAVLSMFDTGDSFLEDAGSCVMRLDGGIPFQFLILDLGGGISGDHRKRKIQPSEISSGPFIALWQGISTPGLRWNQAPPSPAVSGLFSRAILDGRTTRPLGSQNYAMITRDYLNLNARVDFHFAMVDAVSSTNPRGNHIRFRFKGGGTTGIQRERRAKFVAMVMREYDFSYQQHDDLVTASIHEMKADEINSRLAMIGRLLGFSRLLDAVMEDEDRPEKVAKAFIDGDYGLKSLMKERSD